MGVGETACVQPLCGRVTRNLYNVPLALAVELDEANHGPTCAACWEKLQARLARERSDPVDPRKLLFL